MRALVLAVLALPLATTVEGTPPAEVWEYEDWAVTLDLVQAKDAEGYDMVVVRFQAAHPPTLSVQFELYAPPFAGPEPLQWNVSAGSTARDAHAWPIVDAPAGFWTVWLEVGAALDGEDFFEIDNLASGLSLYSAPGAPNRAEEVESLVRGTGPLPTVHPTKIGQDDGFQVTLWPIAGWQDGPRFAAWIRPVVSDEFLDVGVDEDVVEDFPGVSAYGSLPLALGWRPNGEIAWRLDVKAYVQVADSTGPKDTTISAGSWFLEDKNGTITLRRWMPTGTHSESAQAPVGRESPGPGGVLLGFVPAVALARRRARRHGTRSRPCSSGISQDVADVAKILK